MGFISNAALNKHVKNHNTYECVCGKKFDKWTKLCLHKRNECNQVVKKGAQI